MERSIHACLVTLPSHRELLADLFQRVIGVHPDAKPHAQHALFARCQGRSIAAAGLASEVPWARPGVNRTECGALSTRSRALLRAHTYRARFFR